MILAVVCLLAARAEARSRVASKLELAKTDPSCCAPKPVCCPEPCIKYHHKGPKLCCGCEPGKEIVLKVKNPCTGCETDVPVCLPACCKGEPTVCNGTGFLGRDTIERRVSQAASAACLRKPLR